MSEYVAERFEHAGYAVKIIQDDDAESPEKWDGGDEIGIVTTNNRYFEIQQGGFGSPDDLNPKNPENKETLRKYWVFPLYMYAHSGVALSLGRGYPFDDQWDAGQVGFVYAAKSSWRLSAKAFKAAEAYVETWNQYLSGDVWGYVICEPSVVVDGEPDGDLDPEDYNPRDDDDEEGEEIDSCWGFYGLKYAVAQAKESADYHRRHAEKETAAQ